MYVYRMPPAHIDYTLSLTDRSYYNARLDLSFSPSSTNIDNTALHHIDH
jgi:hypothetical protein